jgi:hypothetical protein
VTANEIVRRIRRLLALSSKDRPISVDRLEDVACIGDNEVYKIARSGRMTEATRIRLERALTLVENDQLIVKRGIGNTFPPTPASYAVRPPKPPQMNVQRVEFTARGPRIRTVATNPRAFPDLTSPAKGRK